MFGPSPAEPNNFCPADAHGIGRTCTINVGTSSAAPPSYSLTVARRAPDLNALSAPRPPGQPTVDCDDVDAVYARVRASGAEIVREIGDEEWGVRRFFVRDPNGRVVNVLNAPSPAATASLNIGKLIVDRLA